MKRLLLLIAAVSVLSCGSNKNTSDGPSNLQAELNEKNKAAIPLLVQIRQKPGIVIKNGVPALQRANNSISRSNNSFDNAGQEPLYVLDGLIVGQSFSAIDELVENYMVKKIEILSGSEASFYGSRGANGVIKITTFTGEEDDAPQNKGGN